METPQNHLEVSYFSRRSETTIALMTVGDALRRSAAQWPDQDALIELDSEGHNARRWTYAGLLEESLRLAAVMAGRHAKGAKIAIWAPNIPEWILLEFACGLAGVTLVTVNPSFQERELEYVLRQSNAEALYYVDDIRGNKLKEMGETVCSRTPSIKRMINMTRGDELFHGPSGELPAVVHTDPAQIQYTSGTTGFPKGAVLHHGGLVRNGHDFGVGIGTAPGRRAINIMPLFHCGGCVMMTLGPLTNGCTLYLPPMFHADTILKVIDREGIELFFGVPTMLQALGEAKQRLGLDCASVKHISSGGAMVSPELARSTRELFGPLVQILYGQTEASPVITSNRPHARFEDATETVGQPLADIDVSIRDIQTGDVVPIDVQGELCARGYSIMTEYNDDREATAKALDVDGWLHTGDLATMDARGFIRITGRLKEMIIRGGENLFPVEIENALVEHPAIAEAAVIGVPDDRWGEQVACFMRAVSAERPSPDELRLFLRESLSPQKTPFYWVWVDGWPLTGSGKIQKFKLLRKFQEDEVDILTST